MPVNEDGPDSPPAADTGNVTSNRNSLEDGVQLSAMNEEVNQDDLIKAQQKNIDDEIRHTIPLVGERVSIDVLLNEYAEDDTVYRNKIENMKHEYQLMRRTRPDGNCFFRAFAFAYFESLLNDPQELERFSAVATKTKDDLIGLGVSSFTVEDFHDTFQEQLRRIKDGEAKTSEDVEAIFNDSGLSDYLVVYLRLVTSCHLQLNADFFSNFIEGEESVKDFCAHEVEPMYRESDHIHIISLTSCTGVNVRISYLDRGGSGEKVNTHDFPEGSNPRIHLLYRPGHYDILYYTGDSSLNNSSLNGASSN